MNMSLCHFFFQMSFSWSTSNPPFAGIKPTTSFADALKRLAEHVEEKNRTSKLLLFEQG